MKLKMKNDHDILEKNNIITICFSLVILLFNFNNVVSFFKVLKNVLKNCINIIELSIIKVIFAKL